MSNPWLYTLGSVVFLAASIVFHPEISADPSWYLLAVVGFVVGSLMFAFAGIWGVWDVMRLQTHDIDAWGAAIISLIGALLLLAGSLAFWPGLDEAGPAIGTYTFRTGSIAYIFSSAWNLHAIWAATPPPHRLEVAGRRELIKLVSYAMGALGFIAGGMSYVEDAAVQGSTLWALGSLMFMVGSAVSLSQPRISQKTRLGAEKTIRMVASRECRPADQHR